MSCSDGCCDDSVHHLAAVLVVPDVRASGEWLQRALGFTPAQLHGDPACFAMTHRGPAELMLTSEGAEGRRPNGRGGAWDLYLRVADLAPELARLRAQGVVPSSGPVDREYGMREIEVDSPDGHRIAIGQPLW
jgi:catechol 2,3-dioxygenase-like lactoylglutathione lyase family enzyme